MPKIALSVVVDLKDPLTEEDFHELVNGVTSYLYPNCYSSDNVQGVSCCRDVELTRRLNDDD